MGSKVSFSIILFSFLLATLASASPFISGNIFGPSGSTSRALLEDKKPCKIDFGKKNYSIITSKCQPPDYPAKNCCVAFKEFACPYTNYINDLSTNCALDMFGYINNEFPIGLFANKCKEGKEGLDCNKVKPIES